MNGSAIITWGFRESAPIEEIAECVKRISHGSVHLRQYPMDIGDYSVIISDHEVDDTEAEQIWNGRYE